MAASKRSINQKLKPSADRRQLPVARSRDRPAKRPASVEVLTSSIDAEGPAQASDPASVNLRQVVEGVARQLLELGQGTIRPEICSAGTSLNLRWHVEVTLGPADQIELEPVNSPDDPPKSALELTSELLQQPGVWLRTPNDNLGDRRPIDLIDTDEEDKVTNLLRAFQSGMFS